MPQPHTALDVQIGGSHYKGFAIQPVEYSHKNQLSFLAGCVLKRICRFNRPGGKGRQDLEKARHELQLLLELHAETPDEPPAHLYRICDLRIQPTEFCVANAIPNWQKMVIQDITYYNRENGEIRMLQTAIDTLSTAINIKYPAE